MLAFVTNSSRPFNLGVEEIIYLNDLGVSGAVVTAMMQRDEALKGLMGGPAPGPAPSASAAPASQAAPEPGDPGMYAPQRTAAPAPPEMAPEGTPPGDNTTASSSAPPAAVAGYSTFYDSLAPYGTWVDVAGYGPCWQPTVVVANPAWRPYCDGGRWVYTDCGWYWMSGYSWGWAPFHYGRWFQHHRMGWCWAPDTVWGPSWVCWRFGSSYCGWAPLPPGAWYRPGVGLTFRGRQVSATFGFGLGVSSFAFVDVGHFRNGHLNRQALPPQQAAQVYGRTVTSTTIVGNQHGVINHGIPVSRVAAATGTQVHPVAIRDANGAARHGARGEQLDGNSRTLSVVRPNFSAPSRNQPTSDGRSRSELRNEGSSSARAPGTQKMGSDPGPRAGGRTTPVQANGSDHTITRTDHPTAGGMGTAATATGSTRTAGTVSGKLAPSSAAPPLLRAPTHSAQTPDKSAAGSVSQTAQPKPAVSAWTKGSSPRQMVNPSPAPSTETSRLRPTASPQDTALHPAVTPRPQQTINPAWAGKAQAGSTSRAAEPQTRIERQPPTTASNYQAPSEARRTSPALTTDAARPRATTPPQESLQRPSANQRPQPTPNPAWQSRTFSDSAVAAPRAVSPALRSEPARQYTAPSYQAPAPMPRVAPAPTPAPQQIRPYSPPAAASSPRSQSVESRPSYSAPSAPSGSAPASHSQSSSDRRGR